MVCQIAKLMGPLWRPTWGQQAPGGPLNGPMSLVIWISMKLQYLHYWTCWGYPGYTRNIWNDFKHSQEITSTIEQTSQQSHDTRYLWSLKDNLFDSVCECVPVSMLLHAPTGPKPDRCSKYWACCGPIVVFYGMFTRSWLFQCPRPHFYQTGSA